MDGLGGAADVEQNGGLRGECVDDFADPLAGGGFVGIGGQEFAAGVEDLESIGPGFDLHFQEGDDGVGDTGEELVKEGRVGVEQLFSGERFRVAAALEHIVGECPGGAGEAEECALVAEFLFDAFQGFGEVLGFFGDGLRGEPVDVIGGTHGEFHFDTTGFTEAVFLAHAFGGDEDIAEDDSAIEVEAADGLEGDLCGEVGGLDELDESVFFLEGPVFGEGAAGLAHEPDGGAVDGLGVQGAEEAIPACNFLCCTMFHGSICLRLTDWTQGIVLFGI